MSMIKLKNSYRLSIIWKSNQTDKMKRSFFQVAVVSDAMNNRRAKTFLTKYVPLTLLQGFEKVIQGLRVRGNWRPNRTEIFWPPLLWPSDAQPEAQRPSLLGDGFIYRILSASSLDPNSSGPQAPSAWVGFPYHISSITPSPTVTGTMTSVLTELYNSSTSTQSPTRFLESHVGSSSSGNNCQAVLRSLSSSASVYECTMGIFFLVPFHQPISAHAISSHNCH